MRLGSLIPGRARSGEFTMRYGFGNLSEERTYVAGHPSLDGLSGDPFFKFKGEILSELRKAGARSFSGKLLMENLLRRAQNSVGWTFALGILKHDFFVALPSHGLFDGEERLSPTAFALQALEHEYILCVSYASTILDHAGAPQEVLKHYVGRVREVNTEGDSGYLTLESLLLDGKIQVRRLLLSNCVAASVNKRAIHGRTAYLAFTISPKPNGSAKLAWRILDSDSPYAVGLQEHIDARSSIRKLLRTPESRENGVLHG